MTRIGISREELGDDVESALPDQRIEARDAERAHLLLELLHSAWGEHARQQLPVHGVQRWVLEQQHSGRQLDACLDDVEDVAVRTGEGAASRSAPA